MNVLTDVSVGAMLVASILPETLIGAPSIGPIPLRFGFLYVVLTSVSLQSAVRRTSVPRFGILALGAGVVMGGLGVIRGNELRFWVMDASLFGALLTGIWWANARSQEAFTSRMQAWLLSCAAIGFLTVVGLAVGAIHPAESSTESRAFTASLFGVASLLSMSMPVLYVIVEGRKRFVALGLSFGLPIVIALMSATRSVAIVWAFGLMFVMITPSAGRRVLRQKLAAIGVLAVTLALAAPTLMDSNLMQRATQTRLVEEERFEEVVGMLDYISGPQMLVGLGFGARFPSPTQYSDGTYLAYAPHVGLLTLLVKGGVIAFALMMMVPIANSIRTLGTHRDDALRWACCAGVALYAVNGSLSGGWDLGALFLFGVFVGWGGRRRDTHRTSPPRERLLRWSRGI